MPTRAEFTEDQFEFAAFPDPIRRRALNAGYTNVAVTYTSNLDRPYVVTCDEDVAWLTLLTDLNAADDPQLSGTVSGPLSADGVATITLTIEDSRGAGASGNEVLVVQNGGMGYVPVSDASPALDGSGQAVVTLGPTVVPISYALVVRYADDQAAPILVPVTVTP